MKLQAKKNKLIDKLLADKNYLFKLSRSFGPLLNVLFPQNIKANITAFKECFLKHGVQGSIYFAHKCNQSTSILEEMLENKIKVDVASVNELRHALGVGFTGKQIEATGPKNENFINLGVRHGLLFNVDSFAELEAINRISKKLKEKSRVLIRLNNFSSSEDRIAVKQSRFGIPITEINAIFEVLKKEDTSIDFKGFSFHLDTISLKEKTVAIENIFNLFEQAFRFGLKPSVINIGGGFKVNYLENEKDWTDGIAELKKNILTRSSDIWNNSNYGLHSDNGMLKGSLNIANYYDNKVKEKFLDEILSHKITKQQNRSIGELLSENMIEIIIEPGKSLLDNVGINVAKVTFVKKSANGDILVGLDMNRSNLLVGQQEMMLDPILISQQEKPKKVAVFFVGNLCMENDFIFKRKIYLGQLPSSGDLIVFSNTAGYFMDFSESNTAMQEKAKKIVVLDEKDGFSCKLDENYIKLN